MDGIEEARCLPLKRKRKDNKKIAKQKLVEHGLSHQTTSGRIIPAKVFQPQMICKCGARCYQKIDISRQKDIFDEYYVGSWSQKTSFIRSSTKQNRVATKTLEKSPIIPLFNRNGNYVHFLYDDDSVARNVCRSFFLKCLNITEHRMRYAMKSVTNNQNAIERRGKAPSKAKTSERDCLNMFNFIALFPKYDSHYCRSSTQQKYLSPIMNMPKLYEEYKSSCELKQHNVLSLPMFRKLFKENFDLKFKNRHTDTCKTCDRLKHSPGNTPNEKEKHMESVENTSAEFRHDVFDANATKRTMVLTFDLQKTLETPSLTTSVAFYKRQLWTYNLCIYDEVEKKAYMYVWNESVASRGAQEVGSCMLYHINKYMANNTEKLILWSDSCGGQNKNIKMSLLLKKFLITTNIKSITQKFFISGHSYNSCDRCFALIERKKKYYGIIATPDEWLNLIKNAKSGTSKFVVKKMESDNFYSTKQLENLIVNRKKDISGEKINWFVCKKLHYDKEKPFAIIFINEMRSQEVNIQKRGVTEADILDVELALLYPQGRKINKSKFNDLLELLTYIPEESRSFYNNLIHEDDDKEDFGLASEDSEDES